MAMKRIILITLTLNFLYPLLAQEGGDVEDLSKQAANPIADLLSFPFQNNLNMNYGEYNRNLNALNIQPVLPFAKGRLITRTIFPIVRIPDFSSESGKLTSGLSDIVLSAFYVPKSKITWGIGPVVEFPTGGSERGSQKWSIGPTFLALVQPGEWTLVYSSITHGQLPGMRTGVM